MNGLTLRISSDKKTKPIKKQIEKEDISSLLPTNFSETSNYVFEKLLSSNSIEEQVKSMKEIFNLLSEGVDDNNAFNTNIETLIHIFLQLKTKSPLLPPVVKFLSTLPEAFSPIVQKYLIAQLKEKLLSPGLSSKAIENCSMTLLLCFENKNFPNVSVSPCQNEILIFIRKSLTQCHREFQIEKVPVKKLEIINGIHSCIQVGISILQKFEIRGQEELISITVKILSDSDLPLDTRGAAGVLTAHLAVHFHPEHWIQLLKEILNSENNLGILSYFCGLLNVLPPHELQKEININDVQDTAISLMYNCIHKIEDRNASESGIVLSAARCMVILTKCLVNLPYSITAQLLDSLMIYIWSHIDHYMDAVRHLAMSILSNIRLVAEAYPELEIFKMIFNQMQDMSVDKRSKHAAISLLISHIPVSKIISQSPGLVEVLLAAALANPPSNYAIRSLEELICQDFLEQTEKDKWFKLWVNPLLSSELSAPLELLLTSVLKIYPSVIKHIVDLGFNENNVNISVILTCLKIGRKSKFLLEKDDNHKWKGLVDYEALEKFMYSYCDDVRLSCFALIIETSKTTEEFTSVELNLIKTFLKYNFANQDPAVRQKSLAYCKKLLTRLKDSQAALRRQQLKCPSSEKTHENISCILGEYSRLISDISSMCLESLFPDASPSRRAFSFGLLAIYKELGFWTDFNENTVQILLSCLLDSYEENKLIAKQLLACVPRNLLKFNDEAHVQRYIEETLALSSSIRPPDSISAAYYMSLLASYDGIGSEPNLISGTLYHCIHLTLEALEKELKVAQESLLKAACSGPLYGHLFVIRYLLQEIYNTNIREVGTCAKWCSLVQRIIEVAFCCNACVANVVYNSSPEGHLPMDFSYTHLKSDTDPQVTSQMVLLCAWRTVKEVSLLLGEMTEKATIYDSENGNGLISEAQVLAIGEHLTELLSETKHRGAFEQAYLGFSKLTSRLWRCTSGSLHGLPEKWLNETLECIALNESISATRRSAGIPFIVQALICSELVNGSCKSLHTTMQYLLKLAKSDSLEGRVHALNILRALYRGSSLGEAVGPYVAEGIATAISGFNANNWAERNSSTLLLSALMSRVFGVPRGKSEALSWRNKMTGRLFFQRYPNLFTELLFHLESSSKVDMYPALYPVLLLLGRLYPSSLEGTDSNLQLLAYVPFVMQCSQSSIFKTRSLAASAVSSLIAPSSYADYISELLKTIKDIKIENHRHGILLMVLKLMSYQESMNFDKTSSYTISTWLDTLIVILKSPDCSFITKDTTIMIIIRLMLNAFTEFPESRNRTLQNILNETLFCGLRETGTFYGREIYDVHVCLLFIVFYIKQKKFDELVQNLIRLLELPSYDIVGTALEFMNFVLLDNSNVFIPEIHEGFKLNFYETDSMSLLAEKIKESKEIVCALLKKFMSEKNHHEDSVKLLRTLQFFSTAFDKSLEHHISVEKLQIICQDSTKSSISSQAINCLRGFMQFKGHNYIDDEDIEVICTIINQFSEAESDDDCRIAIADFMSTNFATLMRVSSIKRLEVWISAVRLLLDEVVQVREIICSRLTSNYVPSKGVETLLELFIMQNDLDTVVVGLLYWAAGEHIDSAAEDDIDDTIVFDKGAANTYYEEMVLNRIACKCLANLVGKDKDIINKTFNQKYCTWLLKRTNILGSSLNEFVKSFQSSVSVCDNLTKCLPSKPYERKGLLQICKLKNLLEVLNQ